MAKVALCIIATNGYIDFAKDLIASADEYFLQGHEVKYHVFSNKVPFNIASKRSIHYTLICHDVWPKMTLYRYHYMSQANLSHYDYVYYIDADMLFVGEVGSEIFAPLTGVRHPGFYHGGGSWETSPYSSAFIPQCKRKIYLAGGFQGGSKYFDACKVLASNIQADADKGVKAVWNDESHWNKIYTLYKDGFKVLTPDYCMVEEEHKRKAWGIDNMQPKIIALAKEHSKYQI